MKKISNKIGLFLVYFLAISFVVSIALLFFIENKENLKDVLTIYWSSLAAIGTLSAWYVQYVQNKNNNERFELRESEIELDKFKQLLQESFRRNPHSAFIFQYEDYINQCCVIGDCNDLRYAQYKFEDKCYNSRFSFERLSDIKKHSTFTSDSYVFDPLTRKHKLNMERRNDSGLVTSCGFVTLPLKALQLPLVINNLNNGFFTKDGMFLCKQEGHGNLTEYNQNDIKHLMLRAIANSGGVLAQMIYFLEYIDIKIPNNFIKKEAKKILVDSDIFIEIDWLIKKIFFFENMQVESYLLSIPELREYYFQYSEIIDQYSVCSKNIESYNKLKKLFQKIYGIGCPISCAPSNF